MLFPPKMATKLPTLFTITIVITGFLLSISIPVAGNDKRTRRVTAKSGKKTGRSSISSRGSSRGKTARRGKRSRYRAQAQSEPLTTAAYQAAPTYPDSIEVIEYGSSDSADLRRLLIMPNTRITSSDSTNLAAPPKRVNVRMDTSRVIEIQQALASKGFYQGEMSGVYDDSTVDAMRQFQLKENILVTGYPTAHALRRLGLAKW
jgi:Putative peptidoglycan binding domain